MSRRDMEPRSFLAGMVLLSILWVLFLAGAISTALYIAGRFAGVW